MIRYVIVGSLLHVFHKNVKVDVLSGNLKIWKFGNRVFFNQVHATWNFGNVGVLRLKNAEFPVFASYVYVYVFVEETCSRTSLAVHTSGAFRCAQSSD